MKKLFSIILLLVYFTVSTGFVVNMHYCMGRLDSVQLGENKKESCSKCGMQKKENNGCCRDDVKVYKLQQDSGPAAAIQFTFQSLTAVLDHIGFILEPFSPVLEDKYAGVTHAPPLLSEQDTYLFNCVFRL